MKILRLARHATLTLSGVILLFVVRPAHAEIVPPGRLAFYYAYPSLVNGAAGNLDKAAQTFAAYDMVVFGGDLELPQHIGAEGQDPVFGCNQTSHFDHDNTREIIRRISAPNGRTQVFGYVAIGGENTARSCAPEGPAAPHSRKEIQRRIDLWAEMGVAGVFLDEAEYSYGTTRAIQDAAIDHAHAKSLRVFINGYTPGDVFNDHVEDRVLYYDGFLEGRLSTEPMNPTGTPTRLGPRDLYLLEHYQIDDGAFVDVAHWIERADEVSAYRARYGTAIAGVTTQADPAPAPETCASRFDQAKFDYAWWSTLLYGFEYIAWGEPSHFSAWGSCINALTPISPPTPPVLGDFVGQVKHPVGRGTSLHTRATTTGTIVVDTATHAGRFVPSGAVD